MRCANVQLPVGGPPPHAAATAAEARAARAPSGKLVRRRGRL